MADGHKAEMAAIEADADAFRALRAREKLGRMIAALQRAYEGTGEITPDSEAGQFFAGVFGQDMAPRPAAEEQQEVEARIRQCLQGFGFGHLLARD